MLRISALEGVDCFSKLRKLRLDDSENLLKEKLRWPLDWLVVCRNPIDVDLNFTVDRGTVL